MEIVPAMVLYEGSAALQKVEQVWRRDQQKEIHEALPTLLRDAGVGSPLTIEDALSYGIQLGLSAARCVITGSAEVLTHGADPNKIL